MLFIDVIYFKILHLFVFLLCNLHYLYFSLLLLCMENLNKLDKSIYHYYWQYIKYQHVVLKFVTSINVSFIKKSSVFLIFCATRSCVSFRVTRLHTLAETQKISKVFHFGLNDDSVFDLKYNAAGLNVLLRSRDFHGNSTMISLQEV
jgi:hypothetical protein